MARYHRHAGFNINLDSLTDILANTVGIMIFVLIYAVIASRGVFIAKRLPKLQPTTKERVVVICTGNALFPLKVDELIDRYTEPLNGLVYYNIPQVVETLNKRRISDGMLEVTGQFHCSEATGLFSSTRKIDSGYIIIVPCAGIQGDTTADVEISGSYFRRLLADMDKDRQYLLFFLSVDSLEVFRKARDFARQYGFDSNWEPGNIQWPLRIWALGDSGGESSGSSFLDKIMGG